MENQIVQLVPIERIRPRPQVRETFDSDSLRSLAMTLKSVGMRHPITVRELSDAYEIIVGERRWRAAGLAGMTTVPAFVTTENLSEGDILELQLIENCAREDLNPVAKARALDRLIVAMGITGAEAGRRTGLSEATVSRLTAMLTLTPEILAKVESGEIPASTAYQIAIAGDTASQSQLADEVANGRLTRDRVIEKKRARTGKRAARRRRVRIVIPLGDGCSVVAKCGITLQSFVSWLEDLLSRFGGLEPHVDLAAAVEAIARKGEAP